MTNLKSDAINLIKEYSKEYPNINSYSTMKSSTIKIDRDIGIDNAKGKYIMFLDPKCYYFNNACEVLFNTIIEEDAVLVQGNYIDDNLNYTTLDWKCDGVNDYKTIATTIDEKINCLKLSSAICSMIFKKEYLSEQGIKFGNYENSQNKIFHDTCLLKDYTAVFINEPIFLYKHLTTDDQEISKVSNFTLEDLLIEFKTIYEICGIYDSYAPEYKYIILNDIESLSNLLLNTYLKFKDIKKYIDKTHQFYSENLDYLKTINYPEMLKLSTFIAQKDYTNAYREYMKLKEKIILKEES